MYDQIRTAIVAGRVQPGQRLPSTRELAGRLAVSRTTVGVAFDRLLAEGFVHGRVGAGTFVSATPSPYTDERPATSPLRPRPVWDGLYQPPVMSELHAAFDFPLRCTGRLPLPLLHLACAPGRTASAGRGRLGGPHQPGGRRRAAERDRPACRRLPRGAGRGRRRLRHQRQPAGGRPDRPGPGRTGRAGRGGGPRIPAGASGRSPRTERTSSECPSTPRAW